jgi:hypothetical protein
MDASAVVDGCWKHCRSQRSRDNLAVVRIDDSGKATFPGVPAGTYYVFGITHNHVALSWDVPVNLKSGTNSLVLDQKNAGALQ